MKKLSGSIGAKGGVKQMKGPGMNMGLKKPRQGKFYNGNDSGPAALAAPKSKSQSQNKSSYLPSFMLQQGGSVPKGGGRKK